MLDFDLFTRVIDEAGPSLGRVDFFNYGEAFLHKRAVEMCEYIKTKFPHIYLYTSTNGLALTEEQARRLVQSGIDEVTFSIDGATPESYVQYRQRGDFEKAIANLPRPWPTRSAGSGRDVPFINWRYILFTWNDSDEEMALARRLAADIGVDRLCWEITDHPENAFSRRFVPGTPEFDRDPARGVGRQRAGQRDPRRDAAGARSTSGRCCRGCRSSAGRAGRCTSARACGTCRRARFRRRRATAGGSCASGAQLCAADGTLIDRDYARAWLPHTLEAGGEADVRIEIPAPDAPGRYTVKFDLVSEGIDWFERCGSPTTTRPLWVR